LAKKMGLKIEILMTLILLISAALSLGGLLMLRGTGDKLIQQRIRHLSTLTSVLDQAAGKLIGQAAESRYLFELNDLISVACAESKCEAWWLYDHDLKQIDSYNPGSLLAISAARRQEAKLSKKRDIELISTQQFGLFFDSAPKVLIILPVFHKNKFSGLLELHFSLQDIHVDIYDSAQVLMLYIALYGIVLIGAGYYLFQRNIIKPARLMLQATEAVSRGDLELRLPTEGPYEISQIAKAYNHMVVALQTSQAETQEHIVGLEKANQQLRQAREELIRSEKMSSIGQLAAGLAHELGNPLAAIIGYLEFLKQQLQGTEKKEIIERSLNETARIDFLVRELLDFAKPDTSRSTDYIDFTVELRACLALLRHQGQLDKIKVIDRLPEELPLLAVNRQKMKQVFVNIILNGVQACDADGVLELSGGEDGSAIWVMIEDNGSGISENDLRRIFDPFFTTKSPGQGTGLGLTVCHRFVEEAGGGITVDSEIDRGTSFTIIFPLLSSSEGAKNA